jgi:hypothetical protein
MLAQGYDPVLVEQAIAEIIRRNAGKGIAE